MANDKLEAANRQIRAVTNIGIGTNAVLAALKIGVGIWAGSMALVADGIHSVSDIGTDFAVLLGVWFGSKEPDRRHPYGHGRAETFAAAFIAAVLILIGAAMVYYAALDIARKHIPRPGPAVLIVAILSIVSKEVLYRLTTRVAVRSYSSALYANAWHHRSDAMSSVVVVIGFISLRLGFDYGDQIAAIGVGLMIILVGVRVAGDCLRELTESAVDSETINHIRSIIDSHDRIRDWHRLRTRMVGREVFLDLHILVDPNLTVSAAHDISESLEKAFHEQIPRPVNITVHIEPDLPELRR